MIGFSPYDKIYSGDLYPNKQVSVFIAANDAPVDIKRYADYVCDGTADEVEINAAISNLDSTIGGNAVLSPGTFNWTTSADGPTFTSKNRISIVGSGYNTILKGPGGADNYLFIFVGCTNLTIED